MIVFTARRSPSLTRADATSMRSTLTVSSRRCAIVRFSSGIIEMPSACSPSRSVVSMISIRRVFPLLIYSRESIALTYEIPGCLPSSRRSSLLHRAAARRHTKCAARFSASTATRWRFSSSTRRFPGLMPAMTMPWKVQTANMLDNLGPGDLITSEIEVDGQPGRRHENHQARHARSPTCPRPPRRAHPAYALSAAGRSRPRSGVRRSGRPHARLSTRFAAIARWPSRSSIRSARSRRSAR